jgi:hypothetical protein
MHNNRAAIPAATDKLTRSPEKNTIMALIILKGGRKMPTLQTDVEISDDRRLRIDMGLPDDLPVGQAHVEIKITHVPQKSLSNSKSIMDFYGCFNDQHAFSAEGVEVQQGLRDEW